MRWAGLLALTLLPGCVLAVLTCNCPRQHPPQYGGIYTAMIEVPVLADRESEPRWVRGRVEAEIEVYEDMVVATYEDSQGYLWEITWAYE